MTTTWTPTDYYFASRAARRAWQNTNDQLALELDGLDGTHDGDPNLRGSREAGVCVVEPASTCHPHASPEAGGLTVGDAEPCRAFAHEELTAQAAMPASSCAAPLIPLLRGHSGSASPLTQTAPGRSTPQVKRGRGQRRSV